MNDIMIRPMTIADYNEVMELWTGTSGLRLRGADSRKGIERYLTRNPGISFVAMHEGKVVGAVIGGHDGRRGYLQHLAVREDYRRQGIGCELFRCCIKALYEQGIEKTNLFVLNDNKVAQNFWQKVGWQHRQDIKMFSFNTSNDENA